MNDLTASARRIAVQTFGVVAAPRSYLNLLYLALAFPLGLAYFCFLVIGWSLGLGLTLIWIGVLILALVLATSWLLSAFERQQAIRLLGADVQPMWRLRPENGTGFWRRIGAFLKNRVTWTGSLFLLLKFPLGVATFVITITGLSLSLALLLSPFFYPWAPQNVFAWRIDTLPEALLASLAGFALLIAVLHLFNAVAWVWRGLAELLLGHTKTAPPAEQATA
jgi:hypothetical protein